MTTLHAGLQLWIGVGVFIAGIEWLTARPYSWTNTAFALLSGALWPIMLPLGLWVAFNPRKAEGIRQCFGTGK